mgnify:CR=1 FL=1
MDSSRRPTLIDLPEELRSGRVVVRPYRAADAEAVFAAIDDSRAHLATFMPWVHFHQTVADSRDFCVRAAANWLTRSSLDLGIFAAGDGAYLGGTGFPRLAWEVPAFEIGYWIRRTAEGRGYVGEAVRLLAQLAFEQLGAQRLEIRCDARNDRSRAVAERLGFLPEARLRNDALGTDGRPRDTLVFALIPEDYARVRRAWWPDGA